MDPLLIAVIATVLLLIIGGATWVACSFRTKNLPETSAPIALERVAVEPTPDPKDLAFPKTYAALRLSGDELARFSQVNQLAEEFRTLASDSAKPLMIVVMGQFK